MIEFKLEDITLRTPEHRFEFQFEDGLNVIHGPVATGKSSLLELIKYALGGDALLSPAVREGIREVSLDLRISTQRFRLSREIGASKVEAMDSGGTALETLIARSSKLRSPSDFLLEAAGIPDVMVTAKKATSKPQRLTFFQLFKYVYVPQTEIDRSVVGHLDKVTQSKRIGAFELLLGIKDPEIARLQADRVDRLQDKAALSTELETVDRFLEGADTPPAEALELRRREVGERLGVAEARSADLRESMKVVTAAVADQQTALSELAAEARGTAASVLTLQAESESHRRLAAQLEGELAMLERGEAASSVLDAFSFQVCPRCSQDLAARSVEPEHCVVCLQPDGAEQSDSDEPEDIARERRRLQALKSEAEQLLEATEIELRSAQNQQRAVAAGLHQLEVDLDLRTRDYVSPRYEQIEAAATEVTRLRDELTELDRIGLLWQRRTGFADQIAELQRQVDAIDTEIRRRERQSPAKSERVQAVSEIFDEIIRDLDMPWYQQAAYIDPDSYLPIVNGTSIEGLSSGGMKMMTNVAYHLALLTFGLGPDPTHIPNLLIIDSPRKNLGAEDEDQQHARRFYDWITTLTKAYSKPFQVIVADNDPPPSRIEAHRIELSYDEPLIRDLKHPGPEGASSIG